MPSPPIRFDTVWRWFLAVHLRELMLSVEPPGPARTPTRLWIFRPRWDKEVKIQSITPPCNVRSPSRGSLPGPQSSQATFSEVLWA